MATRSEKRLQEQVFVRDGRRHYRRRYSGTELRLSLVVLCILAAFIGWIAWRGAHPDPELYATTSDFLEPAPVVADRGPLPSDLVGEDWIEGPVSSFDADNLYEKINGREDYYKAFGFERLTFVSLALESDPMVTVDIECFDLGEASNALGAYAGERSPDITPDVGDGGMAHLDRNALFLTRGRYYIRAIGSEVSPAVQTQLEHLRRRLEGEVAGESLPWAYALFVGKLGLDPGQINYLAENAFSFGFAREVYAAEIDEEGTEIFVVATDGEAEATALADQFGGGFRQYGQELGLEGGVDWISDRYIGTIAGASHSGRWVLGVRGAPDVEIAETAMASLEAAVADFPSGESQRD